MALFKTKGIISIILKDFAIGQQLDFAAGYNIVITAEEPAVLAEPSPKSAVLAEPAVKSLLNYPVAVGQKRPETKSVEMIPY